MNDWNYATWTPWTQPSLPFYLTLTVTPSFAPLKRGIGACLFTSVIDFSDGRATWVFREREARSLGDRMIDYLRMPAHRTAVEDAIQSTTASLADIVADNDKLLAREDVTPDALVAAFVRTRSAFYDFYSIGAFVEPVQIAAQAQLRDPIEAAVRASGVVPDGQVPEAATNALNPVHPTYAAEMERRLAQIAEGIASITSGEVASELGFALRDLWASPEEAASTVVLELLHAEQTSVAQLIDDYAGDYSWSKNNYARCMVMRPTDVLLELAEVGDDPESCALEFVARLKTIDSSLAKLGALRPLVLTHLSDHAAELLSIHDTFGADLSEIRKRTVMTVIGSITQIFDALASALGADPKDPLYLLPEEVERWAAAPSKYTARLNRRRERLLVYQADFSVLDEQAGPWGEGVRHMDGPYIAEGQNEADKLFERLSHRLDLTMGSVVGSKEIVGTPVVSGGTRVIEGVAAVIRDPHTDKLAPGEILVASSTTPDFMPAIRNCAAIVVDWGGQTSHAALTARELAKPCIIGTNYASLVIRSGDLLTLDLETGSIAWRRP